MTTQMDLRNRGRQEHRATLFDALDDAAVGAEFDVVADDDIDPLLVRWQIDRDRALDWEHADPDAEPRVVRITVGGEVDDDAGTIDVRDLKPQRRHEVLLTIFDDLGAGEGFVLVNDHDPKPLYHELRSMHGDVVDWEYASRGADGWRVRVRKTGDSQAGDEDVITRYDVREIPKAERHPTIHHRYGMIPQGETMEIIAPHEPRPLRREFEQQYGDSFTWSVVDSEPGRCRVRITKEAATASDSDPDGSCGCTESSSSDEAIEITDELDVRDLPPAERHELIFEAYESLGSGEGFVLINDHDPKPLYHQFDAEAGPAFRWEYRKRSPGEFRVLIGKAASPDTSTGEGVEAPF